MGLRCSLLGHDYGETTTERDREEQGGEVIVEERELEVCARCGHEKVLSENKEVRTLQANPDEATAETAPESGSPGPSFTEPADASVGSSEVETASTASTPTEHAPSAEEDDGVILEEEPSEDRGTGQWPDEAQQEAMSETADTGEPEPEPSPWPDQEGEDEGFDAKPTTEEDAEPVEFGGGLTPESADTDDTADAGDEGYVEAPSTPDEERPSKFDSSFDSSFDSTDPESQSDTSSRPQSDQQPSSPAQSAGTDEDVVDPGFTSAGPVNPPTGSTDDADTLLVCPECGFERTAARASLRAGDICPECRKGYLAERR